MPRCVFCSSIIIFNASLPLFSVGLSLPTEHSSCVLVLLRRWKIGLRYWLVLGVELCVWVGGGGKYGDEVCEGGWWKSGT